MFAKTRIIQEGIYIERNLLGSIKTSNSYVNKRPFYIFISSSGRSTSFSSFSSSPN